MTRTIELIDKIRGRNVHFALVSGARTTTLMKRLKTLPMCDAV